MLIQIEPSSVIPIYAQLTNQLIVLIARGQLKAGDALPSVRSLASDLGMNMHTVNKSYHELEKKGLSESFLNQARLSIRYQGTESPMSIDSGLLMSLSPLLPKRLHLVWRQKILKKSLHLSFPLSRRGYKWH